MDWTPQDYINLAKVLVYPVIGGGLILFFLIRHHGGIKNFISKMKKVGGEVSKDSLKFDASCLDEPVQQGGELLEQPQQAEALPNKEESLPQVPEAERLSLSDIFEQIKSEGVDAAKRSFEEYIKQFEEAEPKIMLRAFFLSRLFVLGNYQGVFDEYKSMYDTYTDDESRGIIVGSWATCYSKSNLHDKAQEVLNDALQSISDEATRTLLVCQLALSHSESGAGGEAIRLLNDRIVARVDDDERASLYGTLSTVEKNAGNELVAALCLEKKAEYMPTDTNALFEAAYNLSLVEVQSLSLFHYTNLLGIAPDHSTALNNIGVTASELDLEIKSVEFQTKAYNQDSSLACANIGSAYLNAGFVDEAEQMALQGLAMDPPHENNHALMTRINKMRREEDKKWEELVGNSGSHRVHLSNYLNAHYVETDTSNSPFTGDWVDKNGIVFTVTEEAGKLSAEWEETHKSAANSAMTLGGALAMAGGVSRTTKHRLYGTFENHTARINITATETPAGLLRIDPPSYYKLFSYIDANTGDWVVFSTDLQKPYEAVIKRPTDG